DKVPRHAEVPSKVTYLDVLTEGAKRLEAVLNRGFRSRAFDGHIDPLTSGFFVDNHHQIFAIHFYCAGRAIFHRQIEPEFVVGSSGNEGFDPLGDQQLCAEQTDRTRTGDKHDITESYPRDITDGVNGRSHRFDQGSLFHADAFGNFEQLVRSDRDVFCKCAVHTVSHTAPVFAEHELTAVAVGTFSTSHGRCAKDGKGVAHPYILNIPSYINNASGKLVAENYGRVIAKGIMIDVKIGPADSATVYLHQHLVGCHFRFRH